MRLLPKGKTTAEPTNRIVVGSIVEYEQHSQPMLAVVTADKRGKWGVLNAKGATLDLPASRLYLFPGAVPENLNTTEKTKYLDELENNARAQSAAVNLEELWSLITGEKTEVDVAEVTELLFNDNSLIHHLVARRAMLADEIFFKRGKTHFEPRPTEVVEELKVKAKVEAEKKRAREALLDALVRRIRGEMVEIPEGIEELEQFAAIGKGAERSKESAILIDEAVERCGLSIREHGQERAFKVLVAAKHFHPDQNLAILRIGRKLRFDTAAIRETEDICQQMSLMMVPEGRSDLRMLTSITIDNAETKDLDDALSVERLPNGYRVGIHITDVASFIQPGSALEKEALIRATSVYTPDEHIPMLPPMLSEGALSLVAGVDRRAVSYLLILSEDFQLLERSIQPSIIRVHHRLSYEQADSILCDELAPDQDPWLHESLRLLWNVSSACEARRIESGAMQFSRREMNTKILLDGKILLEETAEDTPSHKLVGEMMILANETVAVFAKERSIPMIFRSQEPPEVVIEEVGLDIPEGPARDYYQRSFVKRSNVQTTAAAHFGVGVQAYLQSTSPIRRASDLINQRQLTHYLRTNQPLYSCEELIFLMSSFEAGLDEANSIQRERNRYWLLKYLQQEKFEELPATIIKVDGPKPLAELDVIFMLVPFQPQGDRSAETMKKRRGERIRLRIDALDPRRDQLVLREVTAGSA